MKSGGAVKASTRRPGRSRNSPSRRPAAVLGVLALPLLMITGCSAGAGAGPVNSAVGSVDPPAAPAASDQPAAPGQPAASGGSVPSGGPAAAGGPGTSGRTDASAEARLESALHNAYGHGKPGPGQVRDSLVAAGFAAGDVQVTASRTPTGLEADAVEVGVRDGDHCLVAQIRGGAVSITALPVLAGGLCLVGAAVP